MHTDDVHTHTRTFSSLCVHIFNIAHCIHALYNHKKNLLACFVCCYCCWCWWWWWCCCCKYTALALFSILLIYFFLSWPRPIHKTNLDIFSLTFYAYHILKKSNDNYAFLFALHSISYKSNKHQMINSRMKREEKNDFDTKLRSMIELLSVCVHKRSI